MQSRNVHLVSVSKLCITPKVMLWPLEVRWFVAKWPFRENGAEAVFTVLVKVGFRHLKYDLKSLIYLIEL